MAKATLAKLAKIKTIAPIEHTIDNDTLQIIQYLPLQKKLELITQIIDQSGDGEDGFYNIVKLNAFYVIEMLKTYTTISFTEKQLEDPAKLYDLIQLNHIWDTVKEWIPKEERDYIWENTCVLAREVTNYNHSVLGVLKMAKKDYNNTDYDITNMVNQLKSPEALQVVKDILPLISE